ncbi:STAS domain-containing protein [Streptoalloteichus hindustanus]|nr:STAS domain-containing protein [Streptoalloteichus hindustanus]
MTFDQNANDDVADFLLEHEERITEDWLRAGFFAQHGGQEPEQARADCRAVLAAVADAARTGRAHDPAAPGFLQVRALLGDLVAMRTRHGESPSQTALELSRLKQPVLDLWTRHRRGDDDLTAHAVLLSTALDTLRLAVVETALSAGADIIAYQQQQLMELSTPVIKLWDNVLAVPLIGTLDSARSQVAMESLLQAIVDHQAAVAILDITGVPTIDTMVAQHLLKTAMAARLMGAECVISGIRPQIAQTMVQLGIELGEVNTQGTLADALAYALRRIGLLVARAENA